jgi:hypothetical protein
MTTLMKTSENGWTITVRATERGYRTYTAASIRGTICRFYACMTKVPSTKKIVLTLFEDAPVDFAASALQRGVRLARRDGHLPVPWVRKRLDNGRYSMSLDIGKPIDIEQEFASIVESVDFKSEVTA